jgi:hypothetical protein
LVEVRRSGRSARLSLRCAGWRQSALASLLGRGWAQHRHQDVVDEELDVLAGGLPAGLDEVLPEQGGPVWMHSGVSAPGRTSPRC